MYTFKHLLAVTNRRLCERAFLEQIEWLASCRPAGVILREKDLPEEEYFLLAEQVLSVCKKYGTPCIFHTWTDAARRLGCPQIHLPLWRLREVYKELEEFQVVGASVHSVAEAEEAQRLGATYLTAGHIFPTDCKKGVPARGLEFLKEVCGTVSIPVYGIGGVTQENAEMILAQGAKGYCVMSGVMRGKCE